MYEYEIRKQAKNFTYSVLHILWHLAKINNLVNLQTVKVGEKNIKRGKIIKILQNVSREIYSINSPTEK